MQPARNMLSQTEFLRPQWQTKLLGTPAQMDNLYAVLLVAVTVGIMAYSFLAGPAAILLLYALWLPYAFSHKGKRVRLSLKQNILPALYIALCISSVIWSEYRSITARASLEAASMVLCALTIPQAITLNAFIKGVNLGTAFVLLVTLISGNYGVDYFSGTWSLFGLFGSKNQVGLFAEIGILSSLVYLFSHNSIWKKSLFAVAPLGLSLACLYLSNSATALASLIIVLACCLGLRILGAMPKSLRIPALIITAVLVVIGAGTAINLDWQELGFNALGKDSTLTGRTYLWSEGLKDGMEHPLLGYGFAAFWVPGRPAAEQYWFHFGIMNRSGFHFHNTFVEAFVELGFAGLALITLLYLKSIGACLRYALRHKLDMTGFFALGLMIMFTIRSYVEIDVWGVFGIGQLLFFTIIPYLHQQNLLLESNKPAPFHAKSHAVSVHE